MRKLIALFAFALLPIGAAHAQPFCPGVTPWVFDDVQASDPFCGSITWAATSDVTRGCQVLDANHRLYCPDQLVTRKQMVVFMQRLSDHVAPLNCAAGQVMKWNGLAWTCANDNIGGSGGGGTVISLSQGTGITLTPNPITTSGTVAADPAYLQRRVVGTCAAGSSIRAIAADGAVTCEADDTGTGTVTSVAAGAGLTGGTITTAGTLAVDTGAIQSRVTGTCAAGSSIRAIAANGTVTCEADDGGAANAFAQGGNAFSATAVLGTTDNQPLDVRVNNARVMRYEPSAISPNVIGGSPANTVTAGVRGATIAGGGVPPGDTDPNFAAEAPNRVTDAYGTVGGGFANRAGDDAGSTADSGFATVGGGNLNTASGSYSSIGGGTGNLASGQSSTVAGGVQNGAYGIDSAIGGGSSNAASGQGSFVAGGSGNCAGGNGSFAGGFGASVRPGNAPPSPCFPGVGDSGDADGDQGTFVWADSQAQLLVSTGPDQFVVRAQGGVGINRPPLMNLIELSVFARNGGPNSFANLYLGPNDPDFGGILLSGGGSTAATNNAIFALDQYRNLNGDEGQVRRLLIDAAGRVALNREDTLVGGLGRPFSVGTDGSNGNAAYLSAGGAWTNGSSREFKQDFATVDSSLVLARVVTLPIHTWRYRGSEEGRHMGPTAEDFAKSFGLGAGSRYIATVDADGVALAAIQGLNAKVEAKLAEKDAAIAARDVEIAQLKAGLTELRRAVALLNARVGGDERVAAR